MMMKRFLAALMVLTLCLPFCALGEEAPTPWAYLTDEGKITLKYYSGGRGYLDKYDEDGVTLVIPARINGLPVASISDYLLDFIVGRVDWDVELDSEYYKKQGSLVLSKSGETVVTADRSIEGALVIPEGVTTIGPNAFRFCTGITEVSLPESLTWIGNWSFEGCSGLSSVQIPAGLDRLGFGAFANCTALESINVPSGISELAERTFSGCIALEDVALQEGLESIDTRAFAECASLTAIDLPKGLERIGEEAFYGCSGLSHLTVPASLTTIGEYSFYHCQNLEEVSMPGDVSGIQYGAFTDCSEALTLRVPEGTSKAAQWALENGIKWALIGADTEDEE